VVLLNWSIKECSLGPLAPIFKVVNCSKTLFSFLFRPKFPHTCVMNTCHCLTLVNSPPPVAVMDGRRLRLRLLPLVRPDIYDTVNGKSSENVGCEKKGLFTINQSITFVSNVGHVKGTPIMQLAARFSRFPFF
jgi:hypothetical protein